MSPDIIGEIVGKIYTEIKDLAASVGKAHGLRALGFLIPAVITRVEDIRSDTAPLTSEQKKTVATRVLNLLINLPIVPEWIEDKILGLAVDWFVEFFNRSYSKSWLATVKGLLGG